MRKSTVYLFYILAGAILLWTASLNLDVARLLLPGDDITPFLILAIFDAGALCWLLMFLYHSQGTSQRAIALMAMMADLLGVIVLSVAALFLSGQTLTEVPAATGKAVVWIVAIWTAINVIAIYSYHLADPAEIQEIKIRSLQDRITDEAVKQVEDQINVQAVELAASIAAGMRSDILARLRLPTGSAASTIIEVPPAPADTGRSTSAPVLFASDAASDNADTGINPTQARTH